METNPNIGPIEALYREHIRREGVLDQTKLPENLLESASDWADEPLGEASRILPTSCREWAALVLAITEPRGSCIDYEILEQATALARQTFQRDEIDELISGAKSSGFTIDYLEALTRGLSGSARNKVIDNLTDMPVEMKATENPFVRRDASPAATRGCKGIWRGRQNHGRPVTPFDTKSGGVKCVLPHSCCRRVC